MVPSNCGLLATGVFEQLHEAGLKWKTDQQVSQRKSFHAVSHSVDRQRSVMLSSACQILARRCTPSLFCGRSYSSLDPLEYKMAQKKQEALERANQATKLEHDQMGQTKRIVGAASHESGQVPTKWQRRFLIWTRLYNSQREIPEFVANGTMNRMHQRLRVLFIIFGIAIFFVIFFTAEIWNAKRIERDRNAGVYIK
ncbi:hypothetical protein WR25_03876 [Diploscapter pachys]|uniref:Uncharacterized protein n=1 Tax=Diploscapter pachys TaxID=2018661 RepID=A0A2A2JMP0_9BILA|nr:hypothetical protein WR25_03876 [Diploscapter pachys]